MKRSLLLLGALAVVAVGAFQLRTADAVPAASEHPDAWGWFGADSWSEPQYREEGPRWVAASRVLTGDGSLRHVRIHPYLREGLEWQFEHGSLAPDGLEDGEYASTEYADRHKWCAGAKMNLPSYVTPEGGRFINSLLWADVAVTATLGEPVAGFFVGGNPGLLFPLSEVEPLVRGTSYPRYALVPVSMVAIRGRVFCAVNPRHPTRVHPVAGDRAVIVGEWSENDIVLAPRWSTGTGSQFALVQEDGSLRGFRYWGSPATLEALHRRAEEAESGGLLLAASNLAHEEFGSWNRMVFVDKLERYEADGCRVAEVTFGVGLDWEAARMACPENPVPRPNMRFHLDGYTFEEYEAWRRSLEE